MWRNLATTSTRKKTTTKTATNTTTKAAEKAVEMAPAAEPAKIVPKEIDMHQYITVRNGFHGMLIYKSSRTGEMFNWPEFGSEQEMELQELRNAKNTSKAFFINNWFMFDDEFKWVIDYLGMGQYYRYAVDVEGFDDIFTKTPTEIKKIVSEMSDGQKKSLVYRASDMITSGEIDSRKVIAALEDVLGIDLIEK